MPEQYSNPELVKLAAELRATHYDEMMTAMFDLAGKLQSGEMDQSTTLTKTVQPDHSPEGFQRATADAQNMQDRLMIAANLQIEGGRYRDIATEYRAMQRTGDFFDGEVKGHKLDLNPEYTALELAASKSSE